MQTTDSRNRVLSTAVVLGAVSAAILAIVLQMTLSAGMDKSSGWLGRRCGIDR
jgi:hypothetical protein